MLAEEDIEVIEITQSANPLNLWQPVAGRETNELLTNLRIPDASKLGVQAQATSILSKCIPPTSYSGNETGLVVGYVQSGKTLSFTTVGALARDNHYRIVIVIAGTSIPLSTQSTRRLQRDYRLQTRNDRQWQYYHNPSIRKRDHINIADTLRDWTDPSVPAIERVTVLITVMKHHGRLRQLVEVLRQLPLDGVPVLVIDDEADQASLNTAVQNDQRSTTYSRLLDLRQSLPHHTFLQYTATPQAPLLINIIDSLSPSFAEVLTPGPEYVGGYDFFVKNEELVRTIPPEDIPSDSNHLHGAPPSLLEALRFFFLGVASGYLISGGIGNRSMMVHPSQGTFRHALFHRWVERIRDDWERLLSGPQTEPDRLELIAEFASTYDDLARTVVQIPSFEELLGALPRSIRRTRVHEVNATGGHTPEIDWSSTYSHILVGGRAMDRGFTVEGLTITYMPRGMGVGNADTVQQRARFFGYKRAYLGFCRVFLEPDVRDAYRSYVEHEEDVRDRLIKHIENGRPLSEWKRAFFLDSIFQPTRQCVLDLNYRRGQFEDGRWFYPRTPHLPASTVEANTAVVNQFLQAVALQPAPGHPLRTEEQKHLVAENVLLAEAYESLLVRLQVPRPVDSQLYTGLMLQVERYLEDYEDAHCTVYRMSPSFTRRRRVEGNNEIQNLFQGAYPVDPIVDGDQTHVRGSIYPGDRELRSSTNVTIQIHCITLRSKDDVELATNVPIVAVHLPDELAKYWYVQE